MTGTGLVVRWLLPRHSGGQLAIWGGDRHAWGDVHFYLAWLLAGLVIVHLILHWRWVCAVAGEFLRRRPTDTPEGRRRGDAWYGAAALAGTLAVLGAFLGAAWLSVSSINP